MAFLLGSLVLCPMISALAFNAPQATPMADTVELDARIGMPQPTEAPNVQELHRRQSSNSLYLIEGPDEVCGYQYGRSSGALRLCYTSTCGFATAPGGLGPNSGEIFCYDSTTSAPRPTWTSCIPGGTAGSSCLADSACSDNPGIIVCTVTSEPHCNVGTFVGLGVEAVWCDSTYYSSMIPISTTYVGQFNRVLTTVYNAAASSSPYTPPTPTVPVIVTPRPPVSVSSTPPTPSTSSSPQHSTAIGPIVGGVIGGLALIAAIAAGIFVCLRIKRKDEQRAQQAPGPDYPVQTSTQPANPSGHNPSEKYPATAQATFMPAAAAFPTSKPDEQYQFQQQYQPPPQQYQQHPQPPYQQAPPAQQQSPQSTGNYTQYPPPPEQSAQKPAQYYPQQEFPTQAQAPGTHRDSISTTSISSPGSPAPPYPSNFPPVPEMGEMGHNAYPQYPHERSEMP